MKQNSDSIKVFYRKMVSLWKEIDRIIPNPINNLKTSPFIMIFHKGTSCISFSQASTKHMKKDRRDILNKTPLPTVEDAYASIRREISRREILTENPSSGYKPSGIGSGLITRPKTSGDIKPS